MIQCAAKNSCPPIGTKMDVNSFRRIGSVYVILCCLIAGFGAILCLYRLMEAKPACRDFSCPDGKLCSADWYWLLILTPCRNEKRHHSGRQFEDRHTVCHVCRFAEGWHWWGSFERILLLECLSMIHCDSIFLRGKSAPFALTGCLSSWELFRYSYCGPAGTFLVKLAKTMETLRQV